MKGRARISDKISFRLPSFVYKNSIRGKLLVVFNKELKLIFFLLSFLYLTQKMGCL